MEFIKELKKKSFLKNLPWIVLCLVFGIAMLTAYEIAANIVGLVLAAVAVILVVHPLTGKCQKQVLAKANQLCPQDPESVLRDAAMLYHSQKSNKHIRAGYGLFFWEDGSQQRLFALQEVCWLYQLVTTRKAYGLITVGKTYAVVIRTADGEKLQFDIKKDLAAAKLQELHEIFPCAVVGYSQEKEALYNQGPARFAQLAATVRNQQR